MDEKLESEFEIRGRFDEFQPNEEFKKGEEAVWEGSAPRRSSYRLSTQPTYG